MNCTLLAAAALSDASSPVLLDSIVKGTALLVLAAVTAAILSRDSAATRHRIWLLALVATLVVPVLSALLPQWRVLPRWAGITPEAAVVETSLPSIPGPAGGAVETPQNCRRREGRAADRHCTSTGCRSAGFTALAGRSGSRCRAGRRKLERDRCPAACVGDWFLRAHPAADGRSLDALEYRTASDGHRVVGAADKGN